METGALMLRWLGVLGSFWMSLHFHVFNKCFTITNWSEASKNIHSNPKKGYLLIAGIAFVYGFNSLSFF